MASEPELPPTDSELAAELALGVLDGAARAEAQRRVLAEPDFAAAVDAWRIRLAPLIAEAPEAKVPQSLWPRIERALPEAGDGGAVVKLRRWRAAALVSTGLAASLAAFLALQPVPQPLAPTPAAPASPVLVAQLAGEATGPGLLAAWHADRGVVRLAATPLATRGLAPELWVIPADGTPRSLGLIDPARGQEVVIAPDHRVLMGDAVTLAVSLEPAGGSPTGLPTGPVVASGKLSRI